MAQHATSGALGGASASTASGGVRASGLMAGASTSGPAGGGATAFALAGAAGTGGLPAGGQSGPTTQGGAGALMTEPNGGIGRVGLFTTAPGPHTHEDGQSGGVIDYARLVVSATAPPAPAAPSDAFWLNPEEVA